MIYVIKGNIELDEKPVYLETNEGTSITVTEREAYDGDCIEKFETTDEYYAWGKKEINGFGQIPTVDGQTIQIDGDILK